MALNIRNPEAERLAAELARQTGETKTELEEIARHGASLPVLDTRPADDILGCDRHGLPR